MDVNATGPIITEFERMEDDTEIIRGHFNKGH